MKTHIPASVKGFLLGFLLGLILLVAVIALYFGFLQEADRSHSSGGAQSANLPTSLSDSAEPTTHTPETTLPPSEPWEKLTFNLPWELHDQCPCNSSVLRRKQPQVAPGPTFLMLPLNIENRGLPPVPNYNGQISNSDLAYMDYFASKGNLYAELQAPGLSPSVAVGYALSNNLIEGIGKTIILVARGDAACNALLIAKRAPDLIKGVILVMPIQGSYSNEGCWAPTEVPVLVFYPKTGTYPVSNWMRSFPHHREVVFDKARKDGQNSIWDGFPDVFYRDLFHARVSEWLANGMA